MRRLLVSRLIRIFTVCLINLIFNPIFEIWNKQGRCPNLAVCPTIPDSTLLNTYKNRQTLIPILTLPAARPFCLWKKYKNVFLSFAQNLRKIENQFLSGKKASKYIARIKSRFGPWVSKCDSLRSQRIYPVEVHQIKKWKKKNGELRGI